MDGACAARDGEAEPDRAAREAQHRWLAGFLADDPAAHYFDMGERGYGTLWLGTRLAWMSLSPREIVQPELSKPIGEFASTSVTENGAPRTMATVKPLEVSFRDDGGGTIYGGCNWTGGQARFADGRVHFTGEGSTLVGCRSDEDRWLKDFMAASPAYSYDGIDLVLTSGAVRIEFAPRDTVIARPPLTEGTRWELADTSERLPVGTLPDPKEQRSLRHGGGHENTDLYITDTAVRGTAGCTSFSGPVTLTDTTITFGTLDVDRSGCKTRAAAPKFGDVDWVYDLLEGELTLELTGRDLTLRHPASGRGATFAGDSAAEMAERLRDAEARS